MGRGGEEFLPTCTHKEFGDFLAEMNMLLLLSCLLRVGACGAMSAATGSVESSG